MRNEDGRGFKSSDLLQRITPKLEIDLGWWEGWNCGTGSYLHAGNVACEYDFLTFNPVRVVMAGVPRRANPSDEQVAQAEIAIRRSYHLVFWYRLGCTPQMVHFVSIDSRGAGKQLRRIDQMGRALRMHIDVCSNFSRPTPGRSGVVEVDM